MSKLTLSIDKDIVEDAKEYAQSTGRSLSSIVEQYLKSISSKTKKSSAVEKSKLAMELLGSVKISNNDKTYKELLKEALISKHLK